MDIGKVAERFIRAAEIERASREHVGPQPLRAQHLPYVHDQADKNGWGKSKDARVVSKKGKLLKGDWLEEGDDPLAAERRAFWEGLGVMPTARELSEIETLFGWLRAVESESERRALLAWARSKIGGKSFRRWCFQVEGIHPETGRRRKDRALVRISAHLSRTVVQDCGNPLSGVLASGHEISDLSATVEEDAGRRDGLNNWAADDAFTSFLADHKHDFSWAAKRNERRRQQEARRRLQAKAP